MTKSRILKVVGFAALFLVGWSIVIGPSSADIRLDTGDLRYRFFGVPVMYERMPEPQRSRLLRLASNSSLLPSEWHRCASFPLPSTNNTHAMCQGFYYSVDAWIDEDPRIALVIAEEVARYVRNTNANSGSPDTIILLKYATSGAVDAEWRKDKYAAAYLEAKGIRWRD